MRIFAPILAVLLITVSGCERQSRSEGCPAIQALQSRDPQSDAALAFRRGDKSLLEMGGYQPTVPGAEDSKGFIKAPPRSTFRMMKDTGDGTTPACDNLRSDAESYARAYNRKMIALMSRERATNRLILPTLPQPDPAPLSLRR